METEICRLVKQSILKHIDSLDWGTVRICGDYKKTLIVEYLFALLKGEYFSKIYFKQFYQQIFGDVPSRVISLFMDNIFVTSNIKAD